MINEPFIVKSDIVGAFLINYTVYFYWARFFPPERTGYWKLMLMKNGVVIF